MCDEAVVAAAHRAQHARQAALRHGGDRLLGLKHRRGVPALAGLHHLQVALDRRHRVLARALHLKAGHHVAHRPLGRVSPALRDGRSGRRRERDRGLELGQGRRLLRGLSGGGGGCHDRRGGRGWRGRRCGGCCRLAPEVVEHAAGELGAAHVRVATVPHHGVAADDLGGGAVALQQADGAGRALLVREVERRRVDLKPGPAKGAGVLRRQAGSRLGGCGLVVGVGQAHGASGAGDELERPGRARAGIEQARAVGAFDRADAREVALRQVVAALEVGEDLAQLLGRDGRPSGRWAGSGAAAGGEALGLGDALERSVHGRHALIAGVVRVGLVDVDGAAHGEARRGLLLDALARGERGGFGAADAQGRRQAGDAVLAHDADQVLVEDDEIASAFAGLPAASVEVADAGNAGDIAQCA